MLLGDKSKSIAVDGVPVGVGGEAVRAGGQAQRHRAVAGVALLLRHGLHLRAFSVEDGDIEARAEVGDVGSGAGKCLLLVVLQMDCLSFNSS